MPVVSDYSAGFHGTPTVAFNSPFWTTSLERTFSYRFQNHFHPFVGKLIEQLNRHSIDGLLDADVLGGLETIFFDEAYEPNNASRIDVDGETKRINLDPDGTYSVYNWELLFHVPLMIAVHLSDNQRFEEAQRWFHYIFDPTAADGRFWRFLGFRGGHAMQVDRLLTLLSKPEDELSEEELRQKEFVIAGYNELRRSPFQPHAVARTRLIAYQMCVVMKYLDNLIAWGDSLFRQDTIETLNEATQVYVLAANLLGEKPQRVPKRGAVKAKTFAQLRQSGLDDLGNALVDLEGQFPFNLHVPEAEVDADTPVQPLFGMGQTLYFCLPRNDKLLGYWDTVADRLFKIRHCMNIQGVLRTLPLFQPPIDPGMLVKAAAGGLDISSLVSGLNQPLAPVRAPAMIQRALEVCQEVRAIGTGLLSALEKQDGEALQQLRQQHEVRIHKLTQEARFLQWKEAEAATEALVASRKLAVERYLFYQRALGVKAEDLTGVSEFTLERRQLDEESFDELYGELVEAYTGAVEQPDMPTLTVETEGGLFLNKQEDKGFNDLLPAAKTIKYVAKAAKLIAPALTMIPDFEVKVSPWGVGTCAKVFDGKDLATATKWLADAALLTSDIIADNADKAMKKGAYHRRADEWRLQARVTANELSYIGRQIVTALIREQVLRHEYKTLNTRIAQAEEIDTFMREKFTNKALYGWMQGELSKLYYEYYKLAFDLARKAEQTMKHDLMRPEVDDVSFIRFNYWDGGRKGLLAGEALQLDVRRMQAAYEEHNKREHELTRDITLRALDPVALLRLKATGRCEVQVPEWWYDLDETGHYMRRIKWVGVSIPAVAGAHTPVTCTLSLLKSSLRRRPDLPDGRYARAEDGADSRFVDYVGTVQSIVTSHARDDAGMFDGGDRSRRLPFEGQGTTATWRIELPQTYRAFDYDTIADVVLHVRYTARPGGALVQAAAQAGLETAIAADGTAALALAVDLRHQDPSEWHRFATEQTDRLSVTLRRDALPRFLDGRRISVTAADLYAVGERELMATAVPDGEIDTTTLAEGLNEDGTHTVTLSPNSVLTRDATGDVVLVLRYGVAP